MKNILAILFLSITLSFCKQTIVQNRNATTPLTPTRPTTPTYTYDFEKYVNDAFYAVDAKDSNGIACVNGSYPYMIPDRIGTFNLKYTGVYSPGTLGRPVWMDGTIWFPNQSNAQYESSQVAYSSSVSTGGLFNLPEEYTIVFRKMPGTDWERISGPPGDYYLGFGGGNIRVLESNTYLTANVVPAEFQIGYLHVLIEGSTGNYTGTVWENGVLVQSIETTNQAWLRNKCSLSTNTNATDHDWIAKFYKNGKMTDSEREDYFTQLNSYFNVGQLPSKPYASDIYKTQSGTSYTAHYIYNGSNAEDTTKTQYLWYEVTSDNGGALIHTVIGNTKTITYTGSNQIRATVEVCDIDGNTWRYVNGVYSY